MSQTDSRRVQPGAWPVGGWMLLTAAAVAVAGCGQAPVAPPGSAPTTGAAPSSTAATGSTVAPDRDTVADDGPAKDESWEFPSCDDVPDLAAPPEAYRDEPIYVADEAPVAEVEAWAESQPGYEDIWIGDHLGWIEVAFRLGAEARQRDLEEEFAGVGVVAVPVERTKAELEALAFRLQRELAPFLIEYDMIGVGGSVIRGVAYLHVGVLTEELRREIERRFTGEPLCVSGRDPATLPAPGPQPEGGEGWRLLADEDSGAERVRVGLAADAAGLDELWALLDAPVPEVDFEEHVVISFGVSYSGSCPDIRLDDVVVDGAVVYPEIVNLSRELECTADYNPHTYVVAVERSRLPSGPFAIGLEAETHPHSRPEERLIVDADLSAAGAVPEPGAARPDAGLPEPAPPGLAHAWPGEPWSHRLDARCGIEWIGVVNGYPWRTDQAMPEEWKSAVEADGILEVRATMRVDPETVIEAELNNKTVLYKPTLDEIPDCDQP